MGAAEDVVSAADAIGPLGTIRDDDPVWAYNDGPTGWTAARTVEHIVDALLFYAGQVARRAHGRLPVLRDGRRAPPSAQLDNARTAAHVLAGQLRDLGSDVAWHPSGLADAAGWSGMAVTELLVHGSDAAHLVGVELDLPSDVSLRALNRVFPWVDTTLGDPGRLLLAVTGRTRVEGLPHDPEWWWQSAPLTEWNGQPRRRDRPPFWS
ncbi:MULTISPECIES: hypothetical protein [Actinomycetes]|uniref:hypothetical protein n=1 Tax=Actinomycetes TaxID=1760 RepID=UPI0035CA20BB